MDRIYYTLEGFFYQEKQQLFYKGVGSTHTLWIKSTGVNISTFGYGVDKTYTII